MTIKTWEDRYNAPGIVSGHITDHMQAEITELRARVASDAITMMRLAGMSQDCALKAKGLEEHLEIAQGTLKNLRERVAELEAELEKSQAYGEQLLQSSVMWHEHATKRTDQIDELKEELEAKDVEIIGLRVGIEGYAACRAELAALKAQKPVAWVKYARKKPSVRALSWQKEPSPAEHALGFVSDALYAEAGAQPVPEIKGYVFYSADFSMMADGKSKYGNVMFIRDAEGRAWWHSLSDEEQETTPLHMSGRGATVIEAMLAAAKELK